MHTWKIEQGSRATDHIDDRQDKCINRESDTEPPTVIVESVRMIDRPFGDV